MQRSPVTIKIVVFSVIRDKLEVFLEDNKLPNEIYSKNNTLDKSASLVFKKKINIPPSDVYFEQLYTISFKKEQNGEIDINYYFLVPEHKISSNMKDWVGIKNIKINKIDQKIIAYAVQRLQWKIEYTNAVYSLLPSEFTFTELQNIYESILARPLDKRNFRKKILSLNIIKPTGHIKKLGKARPAEMFVFREKKLTFVRIL